MANRLVEDISFVLYPPLHTRLDTRSIDYGRPSPLIIKIMGRLQEVVMTVVWHLCNFMRRTGRVRIPPRWRKNKKYRIATEWQVYQFFTHSSRRRPSERVFSGIFRAIRGNDSTRTPPKDSQGLGWSVVPVKIKNRKDKNAIIEKCEGMQNVVSSLHNYEHFVRCISDAVISGSGDLRNLNVMNGKCLELQPFCPSDCSFFFW